MHTGRKSLKNKFKDKQIREKVSKLCHNTICTTACQNRNNNERWRIWEKLHKQLKLNKPGLDFFFRSVFMIAFHVGKTKALNFKEQALKHSNRRLGRRPSDSLPIRRRRPCPSSNMNYLTKASPATEHSASVCFSSAR